jgi:hypothetical protein
MKFETLITRYKNLGYKPKNADNEVELECLLNWIYKTYNVYIYVQYNDYITQKCLRKHVQFLDINSFAAHKIWQCNTEYSNMIYSDKYFREPFDAKFYTVKELYKAIKFQFH